MIQQVGFEKAMQILNGAFALYGEDGCSVWVVERIDEGWDFGERGVDSGEDVVTGVVIAEDNTMVDILGSSIWLWVRGTDPTAPGDLFKCQITVVAPQNLLKEVYGHWDDVPRFHISDWKAEVSNGETRLGYLDWIRQRN